MKYKKGDRRVDSDGRHYEVTQTGKGPKRAKKGTIGGKFLLPMPKDLRTEVDRLASQAGVSTAEWIREAITYRIRDEWIGRYQQRLSSPSWQFEAHPETVSRRPKRRQKDAT
jgi:hypothetical protein